MENKEILYKFEFKNHDVVAETANSILVKWSPVLSIWLNKNSVWKNEYKCSIIWPVSDIEYEVVIKKLNNETADKIKIKNLIEV